MKKIFKALFLPISRLVAIYLIEIAITVNLILYLNGRFYGKLYWFDALLNVLRLITILCFLFVLFNYRIEQAYRANWILIMILSPSFGGIIYLFFAKEKPIPAKFQKTHRLRKKYESLLNQSENEESKMIRATMASDGLPYSKIANYISNELSFNVFSETNAKFFYSKEEGWEDIIDSLKRATKSIHLEFFIISDGELLEEIISVLKERKANGAAIRILYDDFGSFGKIKRKTVRDLTNAGICVRRFNKVSLHVNQELNYRNHRKQIIIDGKIAYFGGVNLADEYRNVSNKKLGSWFDSIFRFSGRAVTDAERLFRQDWNFSNGRNNTQKTNAADEESDELPLSEPANYGIYQIYASSPFDNESVSKNVFLSLLMQSAKSFYFTTPYMVLDDDIMEKMIFCAKSGLDIKAIVPGVPDKKVTYSITKSHFSKLISNGIEVYRFKEGFIHSKLVLSDDRCASVGSVNIDYRSFFLNFENGILLYDTPEIKDISDAFDKIIERSEKIVCKKDNLLTKAFNTSLKFLSPIF
ncbi:MAG TPA: cardiolipin synthase [Spirochaetaceae bacterium]|nr:cardiolipin synthase [Spirochaetaceae bacterium]